MSPSDRDRICRVIKTMGADQVYIGHKDNTVFVAFYRAGGCGKMYRNVCSFLRNRLPNNRIVVTQMTKPDHFCEKAQVREVGATHFHRDSVKVTAERLGLA